MKHLFLGILVATGLIVPVTAHAAGDPDAGAVVYNRACKMCHATGMMNAPKVGDTAAWEDRVAKGEDALFDSTIMGFNKMPARGNCAACSDDDLRNAIAFMLDQSQ
ncbi:MAG: cytochrome c5 family protein [Gammaproteobacteria bacterium]